MKVELTVIAEFPPDVTYGKIKKLAQNLEHAKTLRASSLIQTSICPSNASPPRHQIKWEVPCVDTKEIASHAVFTAKKRIFAAHRIKLKRVIRKLDQSVTRNLEPNPTVFWTWGEEDLINLTAL